MDPYGVLFKQYVAELGLAREEVLRWWDSLLVAETINVGNREMADRAVRFRWPCGPISHPRVIGVYRKYFLLCDELNEKIFQQVSVSDGDIEDGEGDWGEEDKDQERNGPIEPRLLLIEDLESHDASLSQFMEKFVFSPIGKDDEGRTA